MTFQVPIGEIASVPTTWSPRESGSTHLFPYIDISSIQADEKRIGDVPSISPSEAPSRARQLVRAGDVLVSTVRPNLNAVALVPPALDGATASTGFAVLRPNTARVDSKYLYFWVRTPSFVRAMVGRSTGASYPAVTESAVRESHIPLPPLAEQRRIAAMLDKGDEVRRKRRESLKLLDEFLRSAFLDMFGDPVRNRKGWHSRPLWDVAEVERGKFTPRPRNDSRFYGGHYPFLQTSDIANSGGVVRRWKQTLNEQGTSVSRQFPAGTVALAIAANIGDTAIVEFDFYCPDSVVGVTPGNATCAEYLETCLAFFKPVLAARAPMTAQRNINLQTLRPLRVPVPPLDLQVRFRDCRRSVHSVAERMRDHGRDVDVLFGTLSQHSFSGSVGEGGG